MNFGPKIVVKEAFTLLTKEGQLEEIFLLNEETQGLSSKLKLIRKKAENLGD